MIIPAPSPLNDAVTDPLYEPVKEPVCDPPKIPNPVAANDAETATDEVPA